MKTLTTIAALLLAASLAVPAVGQDTNGPREIVRDTTDRLFELVEANREKYRENPSSLQDDIRDILLPKIDKIYSGRLVLGRKSRGMEEEKIRQFSDALADLLVRRYADGLLDFETRDQVEILPLAGNNTERMTQVKTRVRMDTGEQAPVDYVFHKTDEGWKIFDVIVEGISYVATFRNQIGEQIEREGFDATLEKLRAGEIEVEADGG
ncbi:MAG: MlaC/ttg2D family ABC transporter substrate-binding protein [Candidatus Wenzhouxiangella sp. M2_3B_020]